MFCTNEKSILNNFNINQTRWLQVLMILIQFWDRCILRNFSTQFSSTFPPSYSRQLGAWLLVNFLSAIRLDSNVHAGPDFPEECNTCHYVYLISVETILPSLRLIGLKVLTKEQETHRNRKSYCDIHCGVTITSRYTKQYFKPSTF